MVTSTLLANILWGIIGLPLILYPMIILANIMSLAAPATKKITIKGFLMKGFLIITTLYPFLYYGCYRASLSCVEEGNLLHAFCYAIPPMTIGGGLYWIIKK